MQEPDAYPLLYCKVEPKTKTITITYTEYINRGQGVLKNLTNNCESIAPFIEEKLKNEVCNQDVFHQ